MPEERDRTRAGLMRIAHGSEGAEQRSGLIPKVSHPSILRFPSTFNLADHELAVAAYLQGHRRGPCLATAQISQDRLYARNQRSVLSLIVGPPAKIESLRVPELAPLWTEAVRPIGGPRVSLAASVENENVLDHPPCGGYSSLQTTTHPDTASGRGRGGF